MKKYSFYFKDTKPFVKLMMLICIFMVMTSISGFLLSFTNLPPLLSQTIAQILMFGASTLIWGVMFEGSAYRFLEIKKQRYLYYLFLSSILVFIISPFIDGIALWNNAFQFKNEEIFRLMEDNANGIMQTFLKDISTFGLILNILVLAIIPAIMEELFFRGAMQKTMINLVKYRFLGILLTSILFSLVHFQPYSFFPRIFLSLFLGYIYVFGKNIIFPIIFHFLNNLTIVLGSYLFYSNIISYDINKIGFIYNPILFVFSIILIIIIFLYEQKKHHNSLIKS